MMDTLLSAAGGSSLGTLFVRLTADSVGMVKGLKQAEVSMASSSATILKGAAGMALGVTAALAAIGAAGVREFSKFEDAMQKSVAIMGNVSLKMRKEMEETARSLARNSITSADKLAEAYFFLVSAGLSVEQSQKALNVVNQFAIAGMFDLNTATTLLADSQSALGLRSKDAEQNMKNMVRVADSLTKANIVANGSVEQFAAALTNKAAGSLRAANKEVEEGLAVLAAFADRGLKGEAAGEALSIVIRDLQRAALANRAEFDRLNITVFDSRGEMVNLADTLEGVEKALAPMSTEQRRATFEMLGFQDRSLGTMLTLMGASQAIREYEKAIRSAGGATAEVASKQMETFSAQLTITWNRVKDLFITIGESLTPILQALNGMFQSSTGEASNFNAKLKMFMADIAPAIVFSIGLIGDAIWGWMLLLKTSRATFELWAGVMLKIFQGLAFNATFIVQKIVNAWIEGMNLAIKAVNVLLPKAKEFAEIDFRLKIDTSQLGVWSDAFIQSAQETWASVEAQVAKGSFSENFKKEYQRITQTVVEENAKIEESVAKTTQTIATAATPDRMQEDSKWAAGYLDKLGMPGQSGAAASITDPFTNQSVAVQEELTAARDRVTELQAIGDMELELTAEIQAKKTAMLEAYNERVAVLQRAQAAVIFQSMSTTFDSLAKAAEGFAGKQSGVYKAMFAASKAFAIAEAVVKIQQGIANAAAMPFPANLAAIASVVAATASIVSTIQSVKLEFGGERAAGGPVSPGRAFLVGEKGPEMFVPSSSGNIVPNDRMGGETKVEVHNYTSARAEVLQTDDGNEKLIRVVIGKVKSEIGSEIREGRGVVNRALESSFRLRRGSTVS